jgi:hypothetical protein
MPGPTVLRETTQVRAEAGRSYPVTSFPTDRFYNSSRWR